MTLPPNRIGGIRGPDGATLDDVVAQLVLVNASLTALVGTIDPLFNFLEGIFARLGLLSGGPVPPTGWAGLPDYLNRVAGPADYEGSPLTTNTVRAAQLLDAVSRTLGNFGGDGTDLPARTVHELAGDIRAALVAGEGENVYERLGSVRDNSLALLQSLGTLPSTPAGETVKELLAALVECCEGEGEPPGPQPENPQPTLCEDVAFGPFRQTGWADANGDFNLGGSDFDAYVAEWPPLFDATVGLLAQDNPTTTPAPSWGALLPPDDAVSLCLSWDLTDNTAPATASVVRAGTDDWFTSLGDGTTISPFIYPVGQHSFTMDRNIRFYIVVFVNPGDPPPALNFHLAMTNPAS